MHEKSDVLVNKNKNKINRICSGISREWLFIQITLEFRSLGFCGVGKWEPENPEKNPQSKDESQQQTSPANDTRASFLEGPESFCTQKAIAKSQTL